MRKSVFYGGILVSLVALLPFSAAAGSAVPTTLRFRHLGVEQGVSHTTVWDVLQDRSGFLWIGTESALQRWDGYEFVDFRHDPQDPASLSDSGVRAIYEDPGGILYFATRARGVNRYDPARGRFERFRLDGEVSLESSDTPSPLVTAMSAEAGGRLWLGTVDGLRLLDPASRQIEILRHLEGEVGSLGNDGIGALFHHRQGGREELWIGHAAGLDRYLPEGRAFEHFQLGEAPVGVAAIGERAGVLWAITSAGGLYELRGGKFVALASWPVQVYRARSSGDGYFWLATYGQGLFRADPRTGALIEARHHPEDRESLSSDNLLALCFDRSGLLWIGSRDGLSIYDPRRSQFEVARQGRGLPAKSVGSVLIDRRGEGWLGSLEGELIHWLPEQGVFRQVAAALGGVDGLLETRAGTIWVGAGTGLYQVDRQQETLRPVGEQGGGISAILEDGEGYLWLGRFSGLSRVDAAGRPAPVPAEAEAGVDWPRGAIYSLMADRQGFVWVGSTAGLSRIDPRSFAVKAWHHRTADKNGLPYEQLSDVLEDRQGRLWVATYGGGVGIFDRAAETFKAIGSREGLADDRVCSLVEDQDGGIWASTNRGLSRFAADGRLLHNYDSTDGLASDVFLIQSRGRFADGRIVFGGHQGLTYFYPQQIENDKVPPPVVLTELRVGGELMQPGAAGSPLRRALSATDKLTLDYRRRSFALQFAAPHFANPKKNRYAYRLRGYEQAFTDTGAGDRRARYTNLDPGSYTFEVKASNEDGVWNEEGVRLEIEVLPAPWRTPWAYALYAATLAGALWGYSHWQSRRLERERRVADELARLNAELERLVEERTSEVKKLSGLLPICSGCKKIRDQEGRWQTLELYLNSMGDVKLSHGICRDCAKDLYPDLDIDQLAG